MASSCMAAAWPHFIQHATPQKTALLGAGFEQEKLHIISQVSQLDKLQDVSIRTENSRAVPS